MPRLAVIVTVALLFVKSWAVAVNVALLLPAGTVTVPGISMYGYPPERDTTEPPEGAAALKVTVPVVEPPLGMLVGLKVSDEMLGPHPDPVFGVRL